MEENTTKSPPVTTEAEPKPNAFTDIKPTPVPENTVLPPTSEAPGMIKFASPFSPPDANTMNQPIKISSDTPTGQTPAQNVPSSVESLGPSSSNDFLSAIKTETLGDAKEKSSMPEVEQSTSPKIETGTEVKKSNTGLFIIIALILTIASASISGVLVYSWVSSEITPLKKDRALIQNQASTLRSQVETLTKEKGDLQAEVEAAKAQQKVAEPFSGIPGAPTSENQQTPSTNPNPDIAPSSNPPALETPIPAPPSAQPTQ